MDTACGRPPPPPSHNYSLLMQSLTSKLRSSLSLIPSRRLAFFFSTQSAADVAGPRRRVIGKPNAVPVKSRVKSIDAALLKENWLDSLSFPPREICRRGLVGDEDEPTTRENSASDCVIGVDPDLSGALALLKTDESGCSAQVFDTPHLQVLVGKRIRKRLDAKSIVKLLRSLDVPSGATAYIEQSTPFPKDGKQGWWSGGFGYGLWIGILVASGFSVIPIPSPNWKNGFQLAGGGSTKDDSRRVASELFPSLNSQLSRKKDHGRAEALLIAAYGKGLKTLKLNPQKVLTEEISV